MIPDIPGHDLGCPGGEDMIYRSDIPADADSDLGILFATYRSGGKVEELPDALIAGAYRTAKGYLDLSLAIDGPTPHSARCADDAAEVHASAMRIIAAAFGRRYRP